MSEALRNKLHGEIMACWWEELVPHLTRGALLLCDPALDFLDAALAIAADDRASVERWLGERRVWRAGQADRERFDDQQEQRFQFVVVQPWVLAQAIVSAES